MCPKCTSQGSSYHSEDECKLFAAAEVKPKIASLTEPHFLYQVVAIVRYVLAARAADESKRQALDRLTSHEEKRRVLDAFPSQSLALFHFTYSFNFFTYLYDGIAL